MARHCRSWEDCLPGQRRCADEPVLGAERSCAGGSGACHRGRHSRLPPRVCPGRRADQRRRLRRLGCSGRAEPRPPAVPRGPIPPCRGSVAPPTRALPLGAGGRRRGQPHPRRHRLLHRAQRDRPPASAHGAGGRRLAGPGARPASPGPQQLSDHRTAGQLLPLGHAARVDHAGTAAWSPGVAAFPAAVRQHDPRTALRGAGSAVGAVVRSTRDDRG